jgi:hypothetical protein
MEPRMETEIRLRRDDALRNARSSRLARLAASGRSTGARLRMANAAEAMSNALAALARSLRDGETAR